MPPTQSHCEICGQPARVRILEEYEAGAPVYRDVCLACADRPRTQTRQERLAGPRIRLGMGTLLIFAAALLAGIIGLIDFVGITGSRGFGAAQLAGVGVGTLLVLFGLLLRIDVLTIFGAVLVILAAGADLLGIAGADGLGWKQRVGFVVAAALGAGGSVLRRRACGHRLCPDAESQPD